MGFLKNFFRTALHEEVDAADQRGFQELTEEQLEEHLAISRYGRFQLTDAVRPSYELEVVPSEGFRHDTYEDQASKTSVPVVMAAASKPRLFETFMDLLQPLGSVVDVVLETSHDYSATGHSDLYREHIDMPILQSILWDFEDLLTNDGCTGIAVLNPRLPQEVQFDEHKLLIVYGKELRDYEMSLIDSGLNCREDMKFLTEAEHVHSTNDDYIEQFEQLKRRLGVDGDVGVY
ncbi:MAG: hypothetical protein AAGA92_01940 [Planctomycetota bacterium]